jgi:kelch-like protein 24/35
LGGRVGDDGDAAASVLKFDSVDGTWSVVAPMPEPLYGIAACAFGGDIFVFGGSDTQDVIKESVFKYDTVANAWSTLAPMPCSAFGHSASVRNGLAYIVGDQ